MRQYVAKRMIETPVQIVASATIRRGKSMNRVLVRHVEKPQVEARATPVVKWAGGKTRLLPELLSRMPATYLRYFEPFCGGAALFFGQHARHTRQAPYALLNDLNGDLMNVYRVLQTDVAGLIKELDKHRRKYRADGEAYYYRVRESWNSEATKAMLALADPEASALVRAGQFVFLNKTCFNGLWRVNAAGEFNVSHGDYKAPTICDRENLQLAAKALAGVTLYQMDYRSVVHTAVAGDFVYFDPPYDPVSATANFVGYQAGGFGRDQQEELALLAGQLVSRGVHVMLSNSDTKFIRSLYKGLGSARLPRPKQFRIDRVMAPRAINSDVTKRGGVPELIITGGYQR